jgi:CubicO group peptidase (beta-lactamase class C family)
MNPGARSVKGRVAWLATFAFGAAAHGELTREAVRAAADYAAGYRGSWLLIVQHGKVLLDERQNRGPSAMKIYSGTKGFWNIAALAAQEDGILDLDERVSATLPQWATDSRKASIAVRQLLNFSSGLDPAFSLHGDGFADRDAQAIKQSVVGTPGESFIYGPAALQVFHEVLKRKLAGRGETPTHYLERRVLRSLGLGRQRYVADRSGNPLLAAGFTMSAAQWARMGGLLLHGGAPVLKNGLGGALRGSSANPMFGLGFWNNRLAGSAGVREVDPEELLALKWSQQSWRNTCLCHTAPDDLIASIGSGGQRLYVIPSLDLMVVRQGFISKFSDGAFLRMLLRR